MRAAVGIVGLVAVVGPAAGQSIAGHVVDAAGGKPLVGAEVELPVAPVELPPLRVVARSHPPDPYLARNGFYDRRRVGLGR